MTDRAGRFGPFGGRYVPETLVSPLIALEQAWEEAQGDPLFLADLEDRLNRYVGRPTPLTPAPRFAGECGGCRLYLKREDLTHTGAHKINNALGQALLARRMGKTRLVAETGAGQHGVATATVGALLGLQTCIYMGEEDMRRQSVNVDRMRLLGAEVAPVAAGSRTLKDAINEAMRDWVENVSSTHYLLGSALGPHPYPTIVRELQSVIGREARLQIQAAEGRLPDLLIACVGGGSNAIGLFHPFLGDAGVRMVGVEAGGEGTLTGRHAARFAGGSIGVLQGARTYILQDGAGNISATHSVSAGLDYAAVGPEHARLHDLGDVEYMSATDGEALAAFHTLARTEGILPALESAHALAGLCAMKEELSPETIVILNLSGRGDKDLETVLAHARAAAGPGKPPGP